MILAWASPFNCVSSSNEGEPRNIIISASPPSASQSYIIDREYDKIKW